MKKGFTLAEVLITLGVIGIVAALTMPMLIPRLEKVKTEAKLKKFYSVIAQATDKAMLEHGDWSTWDYSLSAQEFFYKYYQDQLQILRVSCKYSNTDFFDCSKAKDLSPYVFLKDGSCISLSKNTANYGYNAINAFWWTINTSCFEKTTIQGRNEFRLGLYNFKNMKYRCNYTPHMCGFSGDGAYQGDLPVNVNRGPDQGACNSASSNYAWKDYECYFKFIKDGMTFKDDYKFFDQK